MWGDCNDLFHHAVYPAADNNFQNDTGGKNVGRVSLVFKRAIDRGNGKKGHGIRGKGRKSKRL